MSLPSGRGCRCHGLCPWGSTDSWAYTVEWRTAESPGIVDRHRPVQARIETWILPCCYRCKSVATASHSNAIAYWHTHGWIIDINRVPKTLIAHRRRGTRARVRGQCRITRRSYPSIWTAIPVPVHGPIDLLSGINSLKHIPRSAPAAALNSLSIGYDH